MTRQKGRIESLFDEILRANQARGWNPKLSSAAKSIVIEAAELLEHFQWSDSEEKDKDWDELKLEVADVFWYLVAFCHRAGFDIAECIEKKIKHIEEKYPEKEFKGHNNENFYQSQKKKYRQSRSGIKHILLANTA